MRKTILLADDSVTIRKVVELTFMGESFELVSVGSGTEAIERLADGGLDLVIADVHMPGADGYEVCQAAKASSASLPVLLLVGTFEDFDEHRAEKVGADDHLKKPFDSQDLLGRVHELLAGAQAGAEPTAADESSAQSATPSSGSESGEIAPGAAAAAAVQEPAEESPTAAPAAEPSPAAPAAGPSETVLSDESVDRIARRVVELLSEEAIRDVAWEVIPDLAEIVIKERLNELESQVE